MAAIDTFRYIDAAGFLLVLNILSIFIVIVIILASSSSSLMLLLVEAAVVYVNATSNAIILMPSSSIWRGFVYSLIFIELIPIDANQATLFALMAQILITFCRLQPPGPLCAREPTFSIHYSVDIFMDYLSKVMKTDDDLFDDKLFPLPFRRVGTFLLPILAALAHFATQLDQCFRNNRFWRYFRNLFTKS